jgi:hypothetical protein
MCNTKFYKIIHLDTVFFAFKPLKSANCSKIYFIDYNIFNRHIYLNRNLIECYNQFAFFETIEFSSILNYNVFNNYSPKWMWIIVQR